MLTRQDDAEGLLEGTADTPPDDHVQRDLLAANIASAPLHDLQGERMRLRELWRRGPTVSVFLRQYGCLFCHELLDDVLARAAEIRDRGAELVVVGNGTVEQAREFARRKSLPVPGVWLASDGARAAYDAAGMKESWARTFTHPGAVGAYVRARRRGHRVTGVFGKVSQLGGVLVTRPPAHLAYVFRSRFAGDHPDLDQVLAAIG